MRVNVSSKSLSQLKADAAACFAYQGDRVPRGVEQGPLRDELAAEMKAERFEARRGQVLSWNANGRYGSQRFLVLGLGPEHDASPAVIGQGCARAVRAAERVSARKLALRLPPLAGADAAALTRAATEGALLGAYRFDRYLNDPGRRRATVQAVEVCVQRVSRAERSAVERGTVTARAVSLARDLVNEPPSEMNPPEMVRRARQAARNGGLQCKVMGPAGLKRLGANALLAVARGSSSPAQVVHLIYRPRRRGRPRGRVVLVGKGVTFDSGGLNLKPTPSMLHMKGDMAGAAAVLATMTALPEIDCPVEVHALLGLVENMTGAAAFKPGDILKTYSGKTVEIGNTDAEGRLVLCDLLAYAARKLKPTRLVDLATLTGASVVALGPLCSAIFSRHDSLSEEMLSAGKEAGEKLWPMPMIEEYLEALQQGPADLKNVGGRWGGAITAALFLGEFVPRELPWVHLDIAGPAFYEKGAPEAPIGGTGAGVRTLVRWLERQ